MRDGTSTERATCVSAKGRAHARIIPGVRSAEGSPVSLRGRLLIAFYRYVFKRRFPKRIELDRAREAIAQLDVRLGGRSADFQRVAVESAGVSGEWVTLSDRATQRTILYLHGGGFMFRTPRTHARLAARLCAALDARAFVARYRLAPEHPLPAAHEDCFAAYRWLLAEGHDPRRIVVMGDSAGGFLTIAVLQRIRDAGLPPPCCGVVFSSGADLAEVQKLDADATREDPMIGAGVLDLLQRVVIAPVDTLDPTISPGAGNLGRLPPLLFHAGSTEVLLDSIRKTVAQVLADGGRAELTVWPLMPHVFQAVHWLPEAREALACVRDFVERYDPVPPQVQP